MACENLTQPDQRVSDAVDVRQELDLRIGEGPHLAFAGACSYWALVMEPRMRFVCKYVQLALTLQFIIFLFFLSFLTFQELPSRGSRP